MPKAPRLSRDELVSIINDFYTFLTTFYIPASSLKHPPPGGWPNITPETTANVDKAPFVIDLIKHLPYIDEAQAGKQITGIHYKSDVVDYSTWSKENFEDEDWINGGEEALRDWVERMEEEKGSDDDDDDEEEGDDDSDDDDPDHWWDGDDPDNIILKNMITLATGYESGGRDIVLDVFKGVIHEDMIRCNLLPSVTVEGFFEDLRKKFEDLKLIPMLGDMYEIMSENLPEIDEAQEKEIAQMSNSQRSQLRLDLQFGYEMNQYIKIYRSHGWPGKEYRKEEALAAIRECRRRLRGYD